MTIDPLQQPLLFAGLALHMAGYDVASMTDELPVGEGDDAVVELVFAADDATDLHLVYADGYYQVRVAHTDAATSATLAAFALGTNHLLDGRRRFSMEPGTGHLVLSDSLAAAGLELHELASLIREMTESMMLLGEEARPDAAPSGVEPTSRPSIIRG